MSKTKQTEFLCFTLRRGNKVLYVRPREIAALSAYEHDDANSRIFVKEVIEELIVNDTPENVLNTIVEFEGK